jgi:predicted HTH transcriptional regulator
VEAEDVQQLVAEGDHASLEVVPKIPKAAYLALTIAAFANSGGGRLLIGAKPGKNILGVDTTKASDAVQRALEQVSPKPEITTSDLPGDGGKEVLLVDIPTGTDTPYAVTSGELVTREGTEIRDMTADEILDRAQSGVVQPDGRIDEQEVYAALNRLSAVIERQGHEIEALRRDASPWRQFYFMVGGVVLGALASWAVVVLTS